MKALLLTIGALAAAFSLAVSLSSASAANGSTVAGTKVAVASSKLGNVLVDGRGHTLYLFAKDRHGKSSCTGQCAAFWPPLIAAGKPRAAAGTKASLLGTTRRPDGRLQVTYNHHPLYTFVKDTTKGQTNGEELNVFGAEWYAVSAAGAKVEKPDATSSDGGSYPAAGGYGPGY
jgi:predicted lipoprotein with Yx(FWY)xxD motif